jgi:methionyl-tRNA synthetase
VLAVTLDAARRIALLVQPFIPDSASRLLDQLGVPGEARGLPAAAPVLAGTALPAPQGVFPRWAEPAPAAAG